MKLSQYIEHLQERIAEYGDHDLIYPDETDVVVPEYNTDGDSPAFVLDHPA